eukprot:CAMPEP_0202919998 /NCGR_PEP_ID=MMETSP1392-20130828/76621_1 /ASSEMBLY_ACC=CAM_ASM_000868 /TAXON_ID=225041 /ORGANISM="Chlamydomonas chlamydogama, Strain SAG 11-48b" /LENGTH=59 /DNA_ID=CAMNT_0049613473 /DNA_START=3013 /DNA_END=3192 /DNA_ORIENTATION=-
MPLANVFTKVLLTGFLYRASGLVEPAAQHCRHTYPENGNVKALTLSIYVKVWRAQGRKG